MSQKYFKYENKNKKRLRVKDLLMIFSIFTLCIITIITTGRVAQKNEKISAGTDFIQGSDAEYISDASYVENEIIQPEEGEVTSDTSDAEEIAYEILPELDFTIPVSGTVIKPFSPRELIYSETMDDWRTHNGIDIACPYGTDVISVERGVVKSVNYDINYGHTVTVATDEYTLIYTSLSSDIPVVEGQYLYKGDLIGKLSDTCMSEICDEPHFHFEMKKNDEYVNPLDYIK